MSEDKTTEEKDSAGQNENVDPKKEEEKKSNTPIIILAIIVFGIVGILYFSSKDDAKTDTISDTGDGVSIDATNDDEWAYIVGYLSGQQMKQGLGVDNPEEYQGKLVEGMEDAFVDDEIRFNEEEIEKILQDRQVVDNDRALVKAEANKTAGDAYVAEYATIEGIKKTENGTLYKEITVGEGEVVGEKTALVHYTGKHINGETFDTSREHGDDPIAFSSAVIIPGLGEALALMKAGDKWEVVVPVETGYGMGIQPGSPIEPNEALIFEIEVVEMGSLCHQESCFC